MRKFPHQPGARSEDALMARWKEASLRSCWRFEDDWAIPETAHLVTAHTHALPLGEAARNLGHARAFQPIGITETIEDLKAFFTASGSQADTTIQQRLTEGWVAANDATRILSCTEPLTGLPTQEHFTRTLTDLYDNPELTPQAFVLATITLPPLPHGATLGCASLVELGLRCRDAFHGSGASLSYRMNTITILMRRTTENYTRTISCHRALAHIPHLSQESMLITYKPLPPTPPQLPGIDPDSPW